MNLGVRFDRSAIGADAATAPAHPLVPELFPALTTPAVKDTHVFNAVKRRSVVRASYSQFASQLNLNDAGLVLGPLYYSYFYSYAIDGLVDGVRNRRPPRIE